MPVSTDPELLKRAASARALGEVRSGMRLGLGTGSTVDHFLELLAQALAREELREIAGVPTSERTATRARELGIPLLALEEGAPLDLCVDGADEVADDLSLVKGLGGALLREKMVAAASRRFVVVADEAKRVARLGVRAPLPVEVVPFAWRVHLPFFAELGAEGRLREREGVPVRTDNGNRIVDLHFPDGIGDPERIEAALRARPGVVETGLFLGMASLAVIAGEDGVVLLGESGR